MDERAFHRWLRAGAGPRDAGAVPPGDDVATIAGVRGLFLLTTDAFSEGTHFLPETPARAIGRALVEANLSDIASKGGRPVAFLLDILVPPESDPAWARDVVRGVRGALARHGLPLAGGDTKPAATRVLVGTAIGATTRRRLPRRDGARPGDLLVVTDHVGRGGWAALAPDRTRRPPRTISRPLDVIRARLAEGTRLAPIASAVLDTSDGLFESAHLLAEASRVAVLIDPDRVPIYPPLWRAGLSRERTLRIAGFGGDYELLATLAPSRWAAARRSFDRLGAKLTRIGRIERGSGAWWADADRRRLLPRGGWDPFQPAPP